MAPERKPALDKAEPIAVRQFGNYFLVRKLAEGGMAEIFLAKQIGAEGFERNVVIKRMLRHLSGVDDFVGMFLDEARLAARLTHQNIVQIYDLGQTDGCYFICMEYLAGEDFSGLLRAASRRQEYVPLNISVRVVAEAARALHFAHEFADEEGRPLRLVHRDISPSNIFVTYEGQVKLLDFGIAKAESRVTNTGAGIVKGKYMYMAPEQARGTAVDRRADLFSLGVSLYEAVTHVRPFARDSDLAVLNAVLQCEYTRPRVLRPDLPPELEDVICKALAPNLADRYQTAEELARDLTAFTAATTSSSGGVQLASYLRESFGSERIAEKTRIPTLATLAASGVEVPGYSNPFGSRVEGAKSQEPATRMMRSTGVTSPSSSGPIRLLGAAVLVLALAGGAYGLWAGSLTEVPPPKPVPEAARPPPPPEPRGDLPVSPEPDPVVAVQPAPGAGAPVAARPVRPIQLSAADIQRVVRRASATIMRCFEQHRAELPGKKGQVSVTFTILGSGRVSTATADLSGKPVGRCLESQVKALRFPLHKDREVTLSLPFAYELK